MNAIAQWYNESPARRVWIGVGAPVIGLVLVMMALAVTLLWSFARQQDDEFARGSRQLVWNAVEANRTSLANMTLDYANWDAAVTATSRRLDQEWLEQNYYSSVLDAIVVFRPGALRYEWVDQSIETRQTPVVAEIIDAGIATPGLDRLVIAPDIANSVSHTVAFVDGQLAVVAVAPITFEDDDRRLSQADAGRPVDFIATLQFVGRDDLDALAANLGLQDLQVTPIGAEVSPDTLAMPLNAANGETVANITWRHERPGTAGFARLAGAVVVSLLLMGAIALLLARRLVSWQLALASREQAAQESARLKTEFIATMSHELRTPLNGIVGYAEIIEEDAEAAGAAGASIKQDAQRILKAARHLSKMIGDILEQSRIDAGKMTLEPEVLNVARALSEVRELVEPSARENHVRIVVALGSQATEAFGDPIRVRQCLLNLASNALKFTHEGSVTFNAHAREWAGQTMVAIDVIDTGIGIAPEELQRLFSPFSQANAEIALRYGGAGLGLSISRKLARAMGGDIVATSELGKGSVFTLLLPLPEGAGLRAA
jgi:signal transduction histidine kinase